MLFDWGYAGNMSDATPVSFTALGIGSKQITILRKRLPDKTRQLDLKPPLDPVI